MNALKMDDVKLHFEFRNYDKKYLGLFESGSISSDCQKLVWQISSVWLWRINPKILTEKFVKSLKIDISNAFCHLKRLWFVSKFATWRPHSLMEQNTIELLRRFHCCYATKKSCSWTEFCQVMKNRLFTTTFDENEAENRLLNVHNPWLKRANIQWMYCPPYHRNCCGLIPFCPYSRRNNNCKEVLRTTKQSMRLFKKN